MIVKMEKVPFTSNNLLGGNGRGSLTAHVLYLIRDKETKKYSNTRSDLFFKINPVMADLGNKLKYDGEIMSELEIENTVREYCQQQHDYIVEKYVKHSRKRRVLDKHNECLDTKGEDSLYYLKGNCTLQMKEYQRILTHVKGDEDEAKKIIDEINSDFLAMYINEVKKQRGIKGKKTKISDIEKMSNNHIKNEENPHIHFFCHSFDPVTKRWINPMAFAYTKQKVHIALEKKYSQFLNQGIAIGAYKNGGKIALREYLAESINNGKNWKETRQSFKNIKNDIHTVINSNKSTEKIISELKSKGIHLLPKGKDANKKYKMNIKIDGSKVELNTESFSTKNNKLFDTNIKKFMERVEFDQLNKSSKLEDKSDKIQSVLEDVLARTKNKLKRDLRNAKQSDHKGIKQKAFKEFTRGALKASLVVNLNKQGNLLFHKVDENTFKNNNGVIENNAKARKHKASIFINPELQGKALIELFELDEEAIFVHQKELFQLMPKTANYRDVVYFNANLLEMNSVDKEYRIIEQYKNTLKRFNLEVKFDDKGDFFLFDNDGRALISQTYNNDNSSSISINNLHPKLASPVLLSMLQEDARALSDDKKLVISPDRMTNDFDTLRHLEVDLMFSTDANSKKIQIDYPNKITDQKLEKMIEQRLDKELERFDKNVQKFSKGKTKYTFTEASGIHLLNNPNFFDYHDKIKEQFNRQIVEMIAEKGIAEIKFSNKDNTYFDTNEKELLKLASELPEEKRKLVVNVIDIHKTNVKCDGNLNKNKSKNKIRPKGLCI